MGRSPPGTGRESRKLPYTPGHTQTWLLCRFTGCSPDLGLANPEENPESTAAVIFTRLVITVFSQRLATPTDRVDILDKLIQGKDDEGKPMGLPELAGETIGYLNAGTGTTSR